MNSCNRYRLITDLNVRGINYVIFALKMVVVKGLPQLEGGSEDLLRKGGEVLENTTLTEVNEPNSVIHGPFSDAN